MLICFKKHVMDRWCVHSCSLFLVFRPASWFRCCKPVAFFAPPPTYHLTEELLGGRINREIKAASSNNLVFREAFDTVIHCSHGTVLLHLFADVFNLT